MSSQLKRIRIILPGQIKVEPREWKQGFPIGQKIN